VKQAKKHYRWIGVALGIGFLGLLGTGCATEQISNKRVYDRYATLLAEQRSMPVATSRAPIQQTAAAVNAPLPEEAPRLVPAPAAHPPAEVVVAPAPPVAIVAPPVPQAAPLAPPAVPAPPVPSPQPLSLAAAEPPAPASSGVDSASDAPESDPSAYVLKVGDVVQVSLRGIPAAEGIETVIDEHGLISLPFINEIPASGQTASVLARNIRQIYQDQGIYQNVSVTINVPTRYYFIQGEIRNPGRFQMLSAVRVSQAIAASGAYTEFASGKVLIRRGGKIYKTFRNARRLDRTPQDDILLEPDDIVEVQRSLW
jgi:polysaccharide export outer membrane protein